MSDSPSIRSQYEARGVRGFYARCGAEYRNPHEPRLAACLRTAVRLWHPDLSHVLDLAAGSGEATAVLKGLGAGRVEGIDPYTAESYLARIGTPAERFTFEDVAAGALSGRHFSLIVCSFALHLCDPSRLPAVAQQLSLTSGALLVLTPHKRPVLRPEWGWEPAGEIVVERVRARLYRSQNLPDPGGRAGTPLRI